MKGRRFSVFSIEFQEELFQELRVTLPGIPQGLKPLTVRGHFGTAEAVPSRGIVTEAAARKRLLFWVLGAQQCCAPTCSGIVCG